MSCAAYRGVSDDADVQSFASFVEYDRHRLPCRFRPLASFALLASLIVGERQSTEGRLQAALLSAVDVVFPNLQHFDIWLNVSHESDHPMGIQSPSIGWSSMPVLHTCRVPRSALCVTGKSPFVDADHTYSAQIRIDSTFVDLTMCPTRFSNTACDELVRRHFSLGTTNRTHPDRGRQGNKDEQLHMYNHTLEVRRIQSQDGILESFAAICEAVLFLVTCDLDFELLQDRWIQVTDDRADFAGVGSVGIHDRQPLQELRSFVGSSFWIGDVGFIPVAVPVEVKSRQIRQELSDVAYL